MNQLTSREMRLWDHKRFSLFMGLVMLSDREDWCFLSNPLKLATQQRNGATIAEEWRSTRSFDQLVTQEISINDRFSVGAVVACGLSGARLSPRYGDRERNGFDMDLDQTFKQRKVALSCAAPAFPLNFVERFKSCCSFLEVHLFSSRSSFNVSVCFTT